MLPVTCNFKTVDQGLLVNVNKGLSMIPSTSNKKPIFQGHNLPQVADYHLHVQGKYEGRQGKVTRSGCKK